MVVYRKLPLGSHGAAAHQWDLTKLLCVQSAIWKIVRDARSGTSKTRSIRILPHYGCQMYLSLPTHLLLPYNIEGFPQHAVQDISMLG